MPSEVFVTEVLKLRRSRITWLSLLAFSIAPLAGILFMWIVKEPDRAAQLGLLGTKADFAALDASWPAFFTMLTQTIGIAGMLLLAVIATYVFGREYAEGTAKNFLAMPIARHWFGLAKLAVILGWWAVLVALIVAEALALGGWLGLAGFSGSALLTGIRDLLLAASVAFLLTPPVAWIATLGRGYMPPLGFALVMLILGNVLGATGWGKWFPWSIVPLFAGVAGPPEETLAAGSMVVVIGTFLAGTAATMAQMRWADNTQ